MTIKEIEYSKEFTSEIYNCRSEEDWKLGRELSDNFTFVARTQKREDVPRDRRLEFYQFGYDGTQLYRFSIVVSFPSKETEQNEKYTTLIKIKKAGSKEHLNKLSDLEKFLIKKGFKNIKTLKN